MANAIAAIFSRVNLSRVNLDFRLDIRTLYHYSGVRTMYKNHGIDCRGRANRIDARPGSRSTGVSFRLIEASPTPFQGSRGKGIQPRHIYRSSMISR